MNIHTPERDADESRADYADRRKVSRDAVSKMTLRGIGDQHKSPSSRQKLRDEQRKNGHGPKGHYGRSLIAHFNRKIAAASAAKLQRRATS